MYNPLKEIKIYTDGSCKPTNPGPAGFSAIVLFDEEIHSKHYKYIGVATNNVAELNAIKFSLMFLKHHSLEWENVVIITDSQYAIGLLEKNWIPRANAELVNEIKNRLENFPNLRFQWIRGHSGDIYNELADTLAKKAVDDAQIVFVKK